MKNNIIAYISNSKLLSRLGLIVFGLAGSVGCLLGGMWASLGIGLGLITSAIIYYQDRKWQQPTPWLMWLFLAFVGTSLVLDPFAVMPSKAYLQTLTIISFSFPLLVLLAPSTHQRLAHPLYITVMLCSISLGAAVLALDLWADGWFLHHVISPHKQVELTKYNRGLSYIVILAFAVMAGLWQKKQRWLLLGFFVLLLVPAQLTESRAAKLGLFAGVGVMLVDALLPIVTYRLLQIMVAAVAFWPEIIKWFFNHYFYLIDLVPSSWQHRIEIWDYLGYRISDKPVFGWGLASTPYLGFLNPHGDLYFFAKKPAPHGHNIIVQARVELGLPGLALALALMLLSLRAACRLPSGLRPFAIGAWMATMTICLSAYDFWSDSLFSAMALTACACGILAVQQTEQDNAKTLN